MILTLLCVLPLLTTTHGTWTPTIQKLDLDRRILVEMKGTALGNDISASYYECFTL